MLMVFFSGLKQYSTDKNTRKYYLIRLKFNFKDWIQSLAIFEKIRYNVITRNEIDKSPSEN